MDAEREARELLEKADAFMNRLRPPAEDDVPVLTDVVEIDAIAPIATVESTYSRTHAPVSPPPPPDLTPLQAAIQAAVAREVDNWLDLNLPDVVLRVLDGVTDQLILQVGDQARKDLLPKLQESVSEACAAALRRN